MRTGSGSYNSTCTGEERKERYQQEGLVPFVSEYIYLKGPSEQIRI
jgi:hypothetical protein